jgi:N-methylhydantoinase A
MRATGRVAGLSVFERHHYRMTQKPQLIADERDIFEINERIDAYGNVVVSLQEDQVQQLGLQLAAKGYEAVAVAFLFSHKNSMHEDRVAEILTKVMPTAFITTSSSVAPEIGEYERSATALFNAYVGPVIQSYLRRLEDSLKQAGLTQPLLVVQSNGGVNTAAQTIPIFTIESGPAAGVVGAAVISQSLGKKNVIATDVGGTTFKVAVIEGGRWRHARETILNQYQLRLPMVDIASIGAGGGSIAWVDGGRLRIGPQSASSRPGPACYGLGGEQPTVTDADLVLGYYNPERFLGGRMKLHVNLAHEAIKKHVADPLFGGDVLAAAAGIRRVVDSQMADLIRKCTFERGYDVREFSLMAYGGAGPAHAAAYGHEAGMDEVIIPYFATVHSAYGAALSDMRFSLRHSDPIVLPVKAEKIESIYSKMEHDGAQLLRDADIPKNLQKFERWVDARFRRQVHHVRIPVSSFIDAKAIEQLSEEFENEYERLFGKGTALKDAGIELVNYGVDAIGITPAPLEHVWVAEKTARHLKERMTWCPKVMAMVSTPVLDGTALEMDTMIVGPAVIEHPGTSIVIHTGQTAQINAQRHTIIRQTRRGEKA